MSGVAAVVTTGIYCRAECAALPLARNVRPFPVAAAAEAAGYRACLQCRPYRYPPNVGAIHPDLVCRAVQLILAGALDDGTEATLASRLGVSARHLRRLFMTHLGVTPDGLARSARAHFARRLLDETNLTITEVAYAAGFGSLRQFHRVFRAVFRASPSDLRAKRRQSDRLVADGGLAMRLTFHGTLDWPAMIAYLAATATPGVEHVLGEIYRRTVVIAGDPGVIELAPGGDDHLILRAHLPHWEMLLHVVNRARRIANLDSHVDEAVRHLDGDPVIGPLVRARPGVRAPGTWDAFEDGVRAIIDQGSAITAAEGAIGRLVARHGVPLAGLHELGLTHAFPPPDSLAEGQLTGLGITRATASTIRVFARATADGTIGLERGASLEQLVDPIAALPGIKRRTAQYIALRLGEPDAFPASDRPIRTGVQVAAAAAKPWRPWRAVAAAHLWAAPAPSHMVKSPA